MTHEFETGAPNHAMNDFILTALSSRDVHELLLGGHTAYSVFRNFACFGHIDPEQLDFRFLNEYLNDWRENYDK